jgi:hypothetical protein
VSGKRGKKKESPLSWDVQNLFYLKAVSGDRILAIAVGQRLDEYYAVAVDGAPGGAFLDDHAHEELGTFKTLRRARDAAEKYARAWIRSRKKGEAAEPCGCGPIRRKKKKGSKRR